MIFPQRLLQSRLDRKPLSNYTGGGFVDAAKWKPDWNQAKTRLA